MSIRADVTIKANNAAMKKLDIEFIKRNYKYDIVRSSCTADMDSFVIIEVHNVRAFYFEEMLDEIINQNDENDRIQAIFIYDDGAIEERNSDWDDEDFNTMYTETIIHYE